jgi:uncharacterized membrane protein SpoIIM required for sporulation/sterol desaturase/sphingolipid hydroxylase (fatty acid hydroxylase superfamily)
MTEIQQALLAALSAIKPYGLFLAVIAGFMILERLFPAERGQPVRNRILTAEFTLLYFVITPFVVGLPMYLVTDIKDATGGSLLTVNFDLINTGSASFDWVLHNILFPAIPFIVFDFFYYWHHRLQHVVPALWEQHKLHHMDESVYCITSGRHHWLEEAIRVFTIVIPMAILIQGESIMLFWGNDHVLWLAVVGVSILTLLLARVGIAHFQRESLLGREIDVLNLRWIGRTFWKGFKGDARTLSGWFRGELLKTLQKQIPAIFMTVGIGIIAALAGFGWVASHSAEVAGKYEAGDFSRILSSGIGVPIAASGLSFPSILGHNIQAIVIILLSGLFSFGVLGALVYMVNMGVIGVVLAIIRIVGGSPIKMSIYGILPHGIFEIPALILASAAILYIGVMLVTPRPQRTLGEVLIEALADWAKIGLGLVLPLLTIAAVIETWVTPILLSSVVK